MLANGLLFHSCLIFESEAHCTHQHPLTVQGSLGRKDNTLHSLKITNGSNKLSVSLHKAEKSLARDKYSSLLGPFISYEENEVLCLCK